MFIDIRSPGLRLPRGRAHGMLARVRAAFHGAADDVTRVLVRVTPAPGAGALRDCAVEVHLRGGRVEVVRERKRRLAPALARALQRAWEATLRRLGAVAPRQPLLQGPLHARLLPVAATAPRAGRDE